MLEANNKPVYRMSGAGKCPRALSAERLGYEAEPAPKWLGQAAKEGNWHEERIKNELRAEGFVVHSEQRGISVEFPSFVLTGHIDGKVDQIFNDKVVTRLLEVKSMSQFEFDRWMREGFRGFSSYADQLTCYMEATELKEALYIVKNRSSGYEDRRIVTGQPSDINAIIEKMTNIEDWLARNIEPGAREGIYPAEFDPNSLECRRCFYKHLCIPEPKELSPMEEADLESAAEEWRKGKKLVEQGQQLVDIAKEAFEKHTEATGIDRWRYAELAISLIHVKETLSYPKKRLLEVFSEDELDAAAEIKLPYDFIKIADLRKEERQNGI